MYFENKDLDQVLIRTKSLVGRKFWSDIILVISPKFNHFCPNKFCPIE